MNFCIGYWNASISPLGKRRENADVEKFAAVVESLIGDENLDVLALSEVSELDLLVLQRICELTGHQVCSGITKAGRSSYNMCLVYRNPAQLSQIPTQINVLESERTDKAGTRFDLWLAEVESFVHIYCCHWPSQLQSSSDPIRERLAGAIVGDLNRQSMPGDSSYAIVLGDFNVEPFSPAIINHLRATRDRSLAARRAHLLFNTSWEAMGVATLSNDGKYCVGTYFYGGGADTQWTSFDQIMVTPSFLKTGKITLRARGSRTVGPRWYLEQVILRSSHFDHLPVACDFTISRETIDG